MRAWMIAAAAVLASPVVQAVETNQVLTVTLPGSRRTYTMARPAPGRPTRFFVHGRVFLVHHDGSVSNVTEEARAEAAARPAVFSARQVDRNGNEIQRKGRKAK